MGSARAAAFSDAADELSMDQKMSDELQRVTEAYLGGTPESRLMDALNRMDVVSEVLRYDIRSESCQG